LPYYLCPIASRVCVCVCVQDTYYIPSSNQATPYGKLYFKVVNVVNKRRKMGVTAQSKKSKSGLNLLCNLDNIKDGTMSSYIVNTT